MVITESGIIGKLADYPAAVELVEKHNRIAAIHRGTQAVGQVCKQPPGQGHVCDGRTRPGVDGNAGVDDLYHLSLRASACCIDADGKVLIGRSLSCKSNALPEVVQGHQGRVVGCLYIGIAPVAHSGGGRTGFASAAIGRNAGILRPMQRNNAGRTKNLFLRNRG